MALSEAPEGSPANPPAHWPEGRLIGERYVVSSQLARGPTAVVYRGTDRASGGDVALKVLLGQWRKIASSRYRWVPFSSDASSMARLEIAAKDWTRLDHPHIVRLHALLHDSSSEEFPVIVMQYCAGGSLKERIARAGPLSAGDGLGVALQACWGLRYKHETHGLHHNLKSENLLFVPEQNGTAERLVISDPGLDLAYAGRGHDLIEWPRDPREADLCEYVVDNQGTPTHMCPELWSTWPTTSPAMDMYAFGVILYELFSGRLPFQAPSLRELRAAHEQVARPNLLEARPDLPQCIAELVGRCLAIEPSARPPTFRELAAELSEMYRSLFGAAYEDLRPKPSTKELDLELLKQDAWTVAKRAAGAQNAGELDAAGGLFAEAERQFRSLDDPASLQWTLHRHALSLQATGQFDEALSLLQEEQEICNTLGDRRSLAGCLRAQGFSFQQQGQPDAALLALEQDEAICRELGDDGDLSDCLFNQAGILGAEDNLGQADRKLAEAEGIGRALGEQASLQQILHYRALVLKATGRLGEALKLLKDEEGICRELQNEEALSACVQEQQAIASELGL